MSPAEIISSISNKFIGARECGEVFFFPSTVQKHKELGVEFEIRLCPALQKKSVAGGGPFTKDTKDQIQEGTRSDAFTPPYNPSLHVGDLQDSDGTNYVILLNKFALLPDHFMLVTKGLPLHVIGNHDPQITQFE
ncbi:hypothetical protein C0993_009794 [Termitomyces sp. T159_Od127]|nr:hypothetical protein C0993_009794 [Termitomyces sp. T159_Od127]